MDEKRKDDIYYVCTMIEFVARATKNRRKDVIARLSKRNIEHQLKVAEVNHCLSFEQVSDEWIEQYGISIGIFDTVSNCKYTVPSVTAIGRVYQQLVSNFNSSVYYSNPDYLRCSYEAGVLLA